MVRGPMLEDVMAPLQRSALVDHQGTHVSCAKGRIVNACASLLHMRTATRATRWRTLGMGPPRTCTPAPSQLRT